MRKENIKISWNNPKTFLKNTKKYGMGVFVKKDIKKGEKVIVFGGYVIDIGYLEKIKKTKTKSYNVIRKVGYQISDNLVFSPTYYNQFSTGEYLNHSCDPNCGFNGQIELVAMRYIKAGEEITMDYAMCTTSNIFNNVDCLCNSRNCRKKITGKDWENTKLQKKYKNYFQPYIKEKIKNLNKK